MKTNAKKYLLVHEMELIIEDMGDAMRRASVPYVADSRPTPHMEMALQQFYDWAKRAKRAGL